MHVDQNKILTPGTAAAADAMGAAMEYGTQQQNKRLFWRLGDDLQKPPADHHGRCNEAGMHG